ncbi:MAG: Rne/Rng family ribonuclease [Candidatus Hydrogenedentes bacterium]|nr:Rne/Rng family ribonuclease [Candidatus Hydrogenedentota bacterium]
MKTLVVNVNPLENRIGLLENKRLAELVIEREEDRSIVGNIYRGRIDAIIPGIQAAFIDIGLEKNGFLYVSDIAGAEGTGDIVLENGVPRAKSRKKRAHQQPIETMFKKNQYVMVQVVKDRMGSKGPRLTNFITFPGRYLVLLPTVSTLGVSRKIESDKERDRLRKTLRGMRPRGMGIISRTACNGRSQEDLKGDLDFLMRSWNKVKDAYERAKGVALLREDFGPILRTVRDLFSADFDRLIIDDEDEFEKVRDFLEHFSPHLVKRVRLYREKRPLFEKMGIETEIEKALRRKIYLKSGGYIAIDHTEALIAIDVNTGKFTGKKQLEDTVLQTNLEAADEIARQLRLRDMGGIIVLDFIDMDFPQNRRTLMKHFREALRHDRARITLSDVSELGMIEMTRKRVRHNLVKALSQPCPYCEGSGMVRSVTTVTFDCLRQLQSLFCVTKEKHIILQVHPDTARRLRGENREQLDLICERFGREVSIESVSDFHIHQIHMLRARNREEISELV